MPKLLCHSTTSPCPLAHALDAVGDRWTLLIVRDLMLRDLHEYKDMLNSYEGISTNILANRLKRMVDTGLLQYVVHPENKTRKLYYLTPAGKALAYTLVALVKWSGEHVASAVIPEYLRKQLIDDEAGFVRMILAKLDRWEAENVR